VVTAPQIPQTKTAYTRDGVHFVSLDRVNENIKLGVAKSDDYKEVQVPLDAVVVDRYAPHDEDMRASGEQQPTPSANPQTTSNQDEDWIKAVRVTNIEVSKDCDILYQAASTYQFDDIKRYCTDLRAITDSSLQTSKKYEVSPQYQAAKNS
jgi:hypothetical protein